MLQYDYILDKPTRRFQLLKDTSDDGGRQIFTAVDSLLSSVMEAYEMVGEMTSSDKQQVSTRLAAVKEKSAQCNHEMMGGAFNGLDWKCVGQRVMDTLILTVEDTRKAQMLRQLQLCEHNLNGILKCGFIEIIVTEYKRLLLNTARLLEYISKYLSWGTLRGQNVQNVLLLCASQLQKLFPLFLHALEVTEHASELCEEVKLYIVDRIKFCLLKVKAVIEGVTEEEDCDDLGGGLFITYMDQALTYLAVFDSSNNGCGVLCDQWRSSVETVLQHAMSIAQITSQFDFKMIHASGEKVLRGCQRLEEEYAGDSRNPSICKLHANSLSNALEELEQRVCASVLKMYLQVFSDPFAPLRALCECCCSKQKEGQVQKAEDLSDLIFNFDTHTDRIVQVALFAVACSEDQYRISGIRSCLASLESLEAHLVPALTTLYLKQTFSQRALASLLVEHWNSEVKVLWQLINGIVDPAALAQVAHDVIWPPTAIIKKSIKAEKALEQSELTKLVKTVVNNAEVFSNQLQVCAEELHINDFPTASQALKNLLLAVTEGKAVLQKLQDPDPSLSVGRVLKRCELLVSCVKQIQPLLEELDNPDTRSDLPQTLGHTTLPGSQIESMPNDKEPVAIGITPMKRKNFKKQLLSIGLPSDAEIEFDTTDAASQDYMQLFVDKTLPQSRFMTSFLYNEKRNTSYRLCATPQGAPSCHVFSRKTMGRQDQLLQQTFSLNVPKLASLSDTLRSNSNFAVQPPAPLSRQLQTAGGECEENLSKDITTPERLSDLLRVQNRIDAVKISSQSPYCSESFFSHPVSEKNF